jgi:SAM-dependent methyltransferase
MRLLELGAGTGQDSLFFQENGLAVVATDLSPRMVERWPIAADLSKVAGGSARPAQDQQHQDASMKLVSVAGKVSHINRIPRVTGGAGSAISTEYMTSMRVGGQQVEMSGACSWVSENDYVAIVGEELDGELLPVAIRNDTSGYVSMPEVSYSYGSAILLIVLGVLLLALMIGIFMIGWGVWRIFKIQRDKKVCAEAERILRSIPRASATSP